MQGAWAARSSHPMPSREQIFEPQRAGPRDKVAALANRVSSTAPVRVAAAMMPGLRAANALTVVRAANETVMRLRLSRLLADHALSVFRAADERRLRPAWAGCAWMRARPGGCTRAEHAKRGGERDGNYEEPTGL
jgi:hypothetical protein